MQSYMFTDRVILLDFLGGPVVKNPPSNAGDVGLIREPRSHMLRGN